MDSNLGTSAPRFREDTRLPLLARETDSFQPLSTPPEQSTWNEANETYGTSPVTLRATDSYGASVSKTVHVRVYVAGGTNGDGTVNVFDAVELGRNGQTRRGDESYSAAADLNNDGVVNIFDAVVIGPTADRVRASHHCSYALHPRTSYRVWTRCSLP